MLNTNSNNHDQEVTLNVVTDFDAFVALEEAWQGMLAQCGVTNPFVRHDWLAAWWRGYGRDKRLYVLTLYKGDVLIGAAPLMRYRTKLLGMSINAIGFIGNHWVEMDLILPESDRAVLCAKLTREIRAQKRMVIFSYFKEASPVLSLLIEQARQDGVKFYCTTKASPYIKGGGSWEEYSAARSHRFRWEYKKKKQLAAKQGAVVLERYRGAFDLEPVLRQIESVSGSSWQGKSGVAVCSSESGKVFYRDLIPAWQKAGIIDISILTMGGQAAAYLVGFNVDGYFFVFDTAFDDQYKKCSAGMLIHNMLLEELFDEGFQAVDFGYVAAYKTRWTDEADAIIDLALFPRTPSGFLLRALRCVKDKRDARQKTS